MRNNKHVDAVLYTLNLLAVGFLLLVAVSMVKGGL